MDSSFVLNSIDAALIIGISLPTLYIATQIKVGTLRMLTILLSTFLIFHGIYHLAEALTAFQNLSFLGTWSDLVFEPVGWFFFFLFTVYFARRAG